MRNVNLPGVLVLFIHALRPALLGLFLLFLFVLSQDRQSLLRSLEVGGACVDASNSRLVVIAGFYLVEVIILNFLHSSLLLLIIVKVTIKQVLD